MFIIFNLMIKILIIVEFNKTQFSEFICDTFSVNNQMEVGFLHHVGLDNITELFNNILSHKIF